MRECSLRIISLVLLAIGLAQPADAGMSKEQAYSLFNQANQSFRLANAARDPQQAKRLYEKAILAFERIIDEYHVENAGLYYNIANASLLKGDIGKAILNYRRAKKLDSSDSNIQKNLDFARSKRIDKVATKTEKRVLQTLFFWHYDFSLKTKFLLTCIFFGIVCLCVSAAVWFGRNASWTAPAIICGILAVAFLASLVVESRAQSGKMCGVITANEVIARQGDGQNYSPSFQEPLHQGTEFDLLEKRPGWLHIKLFDDSDGWIPDGSAGLI